VPIDEETLTFHALSFELTSQFLVHRATDWLASCNIQPINGLRADERRQRESGSLFTSRSCEVRPRKSLVSGTSTLGSNPNATENPSAHLRESAHPVARSGVWRLRQLRRLQLGAVLPRPVARRGAPDPEAKVPGRAALVSVHPTGASGGTVPQRSTIG
jgi:hypothetical protein